MSNVQRTAVLNFMIPRAGLTDCMAAGLPQPGTFGPTGYTIDWQSVAQIIQGPLFIPQAVTIDALDIDPGVTILFTVEQFGFRRKIIGGNNPTFQFPSLPRLITSIVPDDGTSIFNTFWYNYPALPDCGCPAT